MPGVFWIDKPAGPTSHDVVDWVRWVLRAGDVGHCGTLDPAATGLLLVCVGAATKLAALWTGADKEYRASFVLGRSTTTADAEGETIDTVPCPDSVAQDAESTLLAMQTDLLLPPPAFSAVHVDGVRAHALARRGESVVLEPRPMTVTHVADVVVHARGDDVPVEPGTVRLDATLRVSKGTYIRSLAIELGRRLGVPAHLGALRRLASGSARVDAADVVGPLEAQSRGPAPGGKGELWRIRPASMTEAEREDQHAWLEIRRRPPWTGLPIAVHTLSREDAAVNALLVRLGHGQAASPDDPGWGGTPPQGDAAVVAPQPGEAPDTMILVHGEPSAIRPKRVITAP